MLTISSDQAGQRIDNFLMTQLKGVPRSRVYRAIRSGEVRVNKGRVNATYKLNAGDVVRVPPIRVSEKSTHKTSDGFIDRLQKAIVFDHPDFMVLNKPASIAVHGGTSVNVGVIEALKQNNTSSTNLFLIHRLDKDTSGCLLIAKNRPAMVLLQDLMRERLITKEYLLLVHGHWPKTLIVVDPNGKAARTEFHVVQYYKNTTLLRANLITGRMHQIRVHAASSHHPIVGDRKYGDRTLDKALSSHFSVNRLFLHAERLSFHYPNEDSQLISITAQGFSTDDLSR
jgi:23S rRNA pseudouridine955/2504/2580 synthase